VAGGGGVLAIQKRTRQKLTKDFANMIKHFPETK
jgi:hypothetical protein